MKPNCKWEVMPVETKFFERGTEKHGTDLNNHLSLQLNLSSNFACDDVAFLLAAVTKLQLHIPQKTACLSFLLLSNVNVA